ncbi:MAG: YihY family inner membrane protein [Phycisphaerales bacterium]|nr:YihY family inner membrane protein [Phycisphaerales bacterium]MCB9835224.1 YihY family inner membrane protein [Phycisphaera sp.]
MSAAQEKTPRLGETIRVVRVGVRSLYRSRLPQMAAALAFRTLFALIPMLVISVAAIGAFAEPDDVKAILNETFDKLGFTEIKVPDQSQSAEPASTADDRATDAVEQAAATAELNTETGESEQSQDETVGKLVEILSKLVDDILNMPFGAIGAVGVLTLIYASISMLVEIERAFNNVYRAQVGKSWGKRIVQYWVVITLVPILLFSAFYASEQFRGIGVGIAGSVVSVAITALLLVLAYEIIPNTRVHVRTGVVGALVAAVLWELGKWGFREYIVYSASYAKLYGSMALIPLFMLWVYLTWLIILFGLQVAYGLQHYDAAKHIDEDDAEERLTDPAAVLGVLAVIAERFRRGKTTGPALIADELHLPAEVVASMLGKLTRAGVINPVDGPLDNYALAKPAEEIPLEGIMAAMGEITDSGQISSGPWTGAIERLRQAQLEVIRGQSVASLLDHPQEGSA